MTVSVVTGCSTGIGYATALRLARDGHDVIATMRNPSASDLATKADGLMLEVRAMDVDDDSSVASVLSQVMTDRGGIDVLVNNAGLGGDGWCVEETSLDTFRQLMETNYFGALRCIKTVLPSMRERGSGTIINVTSQAGLIAMPGMAPYNASKFALEAAAEALSIEVAPLGIRVSNIEPGAIMTAIWGKTDMQPPSPPYAQVRGRLGATVMAELAHASMPEEVADCIAEAISTDTPRLRWLVGRGAERNVSQRAGWSDEEFAAVWNQPDHDGFMKDMLGPDAP